MSDVNTSRTNSSDSAQATSSPRSDDAQGGENSGAGVDRLAEISALLATLEEAAEESAATQLEATSPEKPPVKARSPQTKRAESPPVASPTAESAPVEPIARETTDSDRESRLTEARLGMASALLIALRHKEASLGSHSLRVSLGCSSWALSVGLDESMRDAVEMAALLHDVGKMALPDAVLRDPERFADRGDRYALQAREAGVEILGACGSPRRVVEAVRWCGSPFDGQEHPDSLRGETLPLESRMIAIVNAYDEMTSVQGRRPARSRDRAMAELLELSGSQFDPTLIRQFVQLLSDGFETIAEQAADRWMGEFCSDRADLPWDLEALRRSSATGNPAAVMVQGAAAPLESTASLQFEQTLIESMHDGVAFVDAQGRITHWNPGAERLTGIAASQATGHRLLPSTLDMTDADGRTFSDEKCLVHRALETNTEQNERLYVGGEGGAAVPIDLHAIPVVDAQGSCHGATVLFSDARPEAFLSERCEALHDEATRDSLTRLANRAEFDRTQVRLVEESHAGGKPCCLIMADIDHFKRVNDTHGHQAGDEVLVAFADLLRKMCREGDLAARYGGEEFALLIGACGGKEAMGRAEKIRKKLANTAHASLGGERITASFGVTQMQEGDTPKTMLRRADRALLLAKERGRDQVVPLGEGMDVKKRNKPWWRPGRKSAEPLVKAELVSDVPIDLAIEKLRGFVADLKAKVISTNANCVEIEVSSKVVGENRRSEDREIPFRVVMELNEDRAERTNSVGMASGEHVRTLVEVSITAGKVRRGRRRKVDLADRAGLILQSLKSYLMASDAREAGVTQFQPTMQNV